MADQSDKDVFNVIIDEVNKHPDRARGELSVKWKRGSAHSIAWEKIDGKPVFFDTQVRKSFDDYSGFSDYLNYTKSGISDILVTRLDNKDLNYDFLLKWVKKSGWMSSQNVYHEAAKKGYGG